LFEETVTIPVGNKLPYGRIKEARVVVYVCFPLAGWRSIDCFAPVFWLMIVMGPLVVGIATLSPNTGAAVAENLLSGMKKIKK
jgi:ABC-type amino acid transport system permease subunit